ncbi:MAG: ribonuclease Y [Candidatus Omnitrophica bacterium]|nr:ribonuclease Y [Candidatus Omnitrophota bacterium]MCB9747116.1 ribonuclease Y [Candidatus Omnitrophota bacterium]
MDIYVQSIIFSFFAILLVLAGYLLRWFFAGKKLREAEEHAKKLLKDASSEAETRKKEVELYGKELVIKMRQDFEKETKERREEVSAIEKRLVQKEENLDKRVDLLEKKEKDINSRLTALQENEKKIVDASEELKKLIDEEKIRLQKISSLTQEEAKNLLLKRLDDELVHEKAIRIRTMEEEIKDTAEKKSRNIISAAIQRCSSEHTAATTVTVVMLPNDEMKGRIIGREGRNIRALEAAAGVDIIIDDTPEAVTISGFDIYRREIAKIALQKLIEDGRIHPGRIEEVVEKAKKEMEVIIKEEGEKVAFDLAIHGMHPELLKLVGKLKFRTSYGQNGLQHTKEVAMLIGSMASQLGLDPKVAMRAGLLHDIGKVVSQDVEEGTHAIVGGNLARKYGESEDVANAVESHHEEVEKASLYGALVCAADAISAARPGARAETLETYVKRLENLERIASSFKGITKSYALQAGREIRIIVDPDKINDDEAVVLARDIRKKIEEEMEYPGQIKVIVLREKRAVEYAK